MYVDTTRIIASGDSAGALTALYMSYSTYGTTHLGDMSKKDSIGGVISISGELVDQGYCHDVDPKTYEPHNCKINITANNHTDEM